MNFERDILEPVEGQPVSKASPEVLAQFKYALTVATAAPAIEAFKAAGKTPREVAKHWGERLVETKPANFGEDHINMKLARALIAGELDNEIAAILGTG